jgi:ABC-type amino acid transport substrate-binding protein
MGRCRVQRDWPRPRPLPFLLCGLALLVGGGAAAGGGRGDTPATEPDPSEAPATGQGGTLRVYCTWRGADYAPFHRWAPAAPAPVGFEADLIGRVATTLGKSVAFVEPPPGVTDPRIEMLTRHLSDVVISTFSITPERGRLVSFSRPYFVDGLGAMVAANAPFQSPNELATRRLLVVSGTTGEAWVRQNWPQALLLRPTISDERSAVATGQVDAYMNDRSHLVNLAAGDPRVRVLASYLTREPWGIAVARDNAALLTRIDAALATLETNGELAALQRRWLGP